jgi:hypothetical protein
MKVCREFEVKKLTENCSAVVKSCQIGSRYIMTATKIPVLQKPELDAFLVTAFSPEIGNHKYLAEMTLDYVTPRGVQLATMFMQVGAGPALRSCNDRRPDQAVANNLPPFYLIYQSGFEPRT